MELQTEPRCTTFIAFVISAECRMLHSYCVVDILIQYISVVEMVEEGE